jgi:outer membrane protein assembly factor BamB
MKNSLKSAGQAGISLRWCALRRSAGCNIARQTARSLPALALILPLGATALAATAPSISLNQTSGTPISSIAVSGEGFGIFETVDIYFDTKDRALASTDGSGAFSGIAITVPASAVPGTHWVTANGRNSGLSAQQPFTVRTNWSEFRRGPAHNGYNPVENVLRPATVPGLELQWSAATGNQIQSSPAVANGVVYVGSQDNNLYAFKASTGAPIWSAATGNQIQSSPTVANGVVYVSSYDGKLYAFNAATGAPIWSVAFHGQPSIFSSPTVSNGVVYVGVSDYLYAFNASTGGFLWDAATGDQIFSSPAVANGVVYVGSLDNSLYAFNAVSGAPIWSAATGDQIFSSPAVANGVVYVGSLDHNLYAFNAASGALIWSAATGEAIGQSSPAVANGVVYIGSQDRGLYAFNASTGAPIWSVATGNDIESSPAVANGVVYVGSTDTKLYAFNATTGALLWSAATGNVIYSSPAVTDGMVYIGSYDNNFYAFALPPPEASKFAPPPQPDPATLHADLTLTVQR